MVLGLIFAMPLCIIDLTRALIAFVAINADASAAR
jgi:hypothetical protein